MVKTEALSEGEEKGRMAKSSCGRSLRHETGHHVTGNLG